MSLFRPVRAGKALLVAAVITTLGLAPAGAVSPPGPTQTRSSSAECSAAKQVFKQARKQRQTALRAVVDARLALRRSYHTHDVDKVHAAMAAVQDAIATYSTKTRAVKYRSTRLGYACSSERSAVRAAAAGKALGLFARANGLPVGAADAAQVQALLDQVLPGAYDLLGDGQQSALLAGFNVIAGGNANPADVLAALAGTFSAADVAALLAGTADPAVLTDLLERLLVQVSTISGGLPVPADLGLEGLLTSLSGALCELAPIPLLCD